MTTDRLSKKILVLISSLLVILAFSLPQYANETSQCTLTTKSIKGLLKMTKNQIERKLHMNVQEDCAETIPESHMSFPTLFDKRTGLEFIFLNAVDDVEPIRISANVYSVKGAKAGMSFKAIMDCLGKTKIKKTWIGTKDISAYLVEYKLDGLQYQFVAWNKNDPTFDLYIWLAN